MTSSSPDNLQELGRRLREQKVGGILQPTGNVPLLIFYHKCPSDPSDIYLHENVVLLADKTLIRDLCQSGNLCTGIRTVWNCEKKDDGRYLARCSRGGIPRKSRGTGTRLRESKKVGCNACLRTISISKSHPFYPEIFIVKKLIIEDESLPNDPEPSCVELCLISSVNLAHNGHETDDKEAEKRLLGTTKDVFLDSEVMKQLKAFLDIFPSGKGCLAKAELHLKNTIPDVHVPTEVLRNVISSIRCDESDTNKFIQAISEGKEKHSTIEYIFYDRDDKTGVLNLAVWTLKGSKNLVERCGDLLFWDSTHHMTPYDYKISSLIIVDSECKSRTVMVALMLYERAADFQRVLQCWHDAFNMRFPQVVFTDGDEGISAALSTLQYDEEVIHMLCFFHIMDLNLKKRVQGILSFGGASWPSFRKQLSNCREAIDEDQFKQIWNAMISKYLPQSKRTKSIVQYLDKFVYAKRFQWALAYHPYLFTLGSSTTQRSEAFNSKLKSVAKASDLVSLMHRINKIIRDQGTTEKRSRVQSYRKSELLKCNMIGKKLMKELNQSRLSKFASSELSKEANASFHLRFIPSSFSMISENNCFVFSGNVSNTSMYLDENDEKIVRTAKIEFNEKKPWK